MRIPSGGCHGTTRRTAEPPYSVALTLISCSYARLPKGHPAPLTRCAACSSKYERSSKTIGRSLCISLRRLMVHTWNCWSERISKRVPSLVDSDEAFACYPPTQLHTNYVNVFSGGDHSRGETVKVIGQRDESKESHCAILSIATICCDGSRRFADFLLPYLCSKGRGQYLDNTISERYEFTYSKFIRSSYEDF
jgi:hypothetical protein